MKDSGLSLLHGEVFVKSGQQFDPAKHCNRKLIGARSFRYNNHTVDQEEFLSPRDLTGHGTHVSFSGKVVMCYTVNGLSPTELQKAMELVGKNGGVALIIAKESTDITLVKFSLEFITIPFIEINYELGNQIEKYIQTSLSSPLVSIGPTRTLTGKPITPKVAFSSSRGPSSITPSILKPDIAAPGEFIVAQTSPPPLLEEEVADKQGYRMLTGTSMAAPHVAGVIALLKATHSDWSPAAMRSALVTTEIPEVVLVTPNRILEPKTTRSWDFLGLSLDGSTAANSEDGDLLSRSNMGDGIIVGILDSGIWPNA